MASTQRPFRGRAEVGEVDQPSTDDLELVERLVRRDARAFEALYDRYIRLAFAVALRVLPDRERAEEVVQDVFVKLWRQPGLFDPRRGAFRPWILRVVHHRAIDELRQATRDRAQTAEDPEGRILETLADGSPAPEEVAESSVTRERILDALDRLSPSQREAIEMAFFDGLTQSEIAERLGEPLGTVKTRVRLGMRHLRGLLGS